MNIPNQEVAPEGVPSLWMGLSITEVPQAAVGEVQLAVGGKEHSRSTGRSGMWQGCTAASRAPAVPAGGLQTLSIKSRHCHAGCSKQACVTTTHYICHLHTEQEGHALWGLSLEAFLWVQLKKGRLVTVEWCMRMYLCCETLEVHF